MNKHLRSGPQRRDFIKASAALFADTSKAAAQATAAPATPAPSLPVQKGWKVSPDSTAQWSHCALAPLYIAFQGLAGIHPLSPGFERVEIRPQLADLEQLELTAHTVRRPLKFSSNGKLGGREVMIALPSDSEGELVLAREENVRLDRVGHLRYRLPAGSVTTLTLRFT